MAKKGTTSGSSPLQGGQATFDFSVIAQKYASWIYLVLTFCIAWFIFQDYLTGKFIYLFKDIGSDSVNFNYPQWIYLQKYLSTEGFPGWSFKQGMGQSYYGIGPAFGLGLMGPFVLFISWMSPEQIPYLIIWFEVFKMICGGLFFMLALRTMGLQPVTTIIGGLLYAFSGYMVLGSGWTGFSMEALAVALLILATEKIIMQQRYVLFPLALAYLTILQPFNLLPWGIYLTAYFLYRFYVVNGWDMPRLFKTTGILVLLSVTGLLISAFYSGSVLHIMLESPRGGGESSYAQTLSGFGLFDFYPAIHNLSAVYRLFSSDLMGGGLTFRGWNNYLEAPIFYGGMLSLLLFSQGFAAFRQRAGKGYIAIFVLFLIPVIFPWFRFAFWAFTGDYYRTFSLCFVLVLMTGALQALSAIESSGKMDIRWLAGTALLWLILLYFPFELSKSLIDKSIRSQVTLFLVVQAILIGFMMKPAFRHWALPALLGCIVLELIVLNHPTANKRDMVKAKEQESRIAYNDYTREALEYVHSRESGFYRIAKDYASGPAYHSSLNDAIIQGYMGTSCYYSFNQKHYINFLKSVDLVDTKNEFSTRWAQGLNNRPLLLTMAGSRYTLHKGGNPYLYGFGYDSLTLIQDVSIFKNRYAIPFGVVYHQWMDSATFAGLSSFSKDRTLLNALILNPTEEVQAKGLEKGNPADTLIPFTFEYYAEMTDKLRRDTLGLTHHSENRLSGTVRSTGGPGILMLPMAFDTGWKITLNGNPVEAFIVNAGLTGIQIPEGKHEINMEYSVPYLQQTIWLSLLGIVLLCGWIFVEYKWLSPKSGGNTEAEEKA